MKHLLFTTTLCLGFIVAVPCPGQNSTGPGNADAVRIGDHSALIASARDYLVSQARQIELVPLRTQSVDMLMNPAHCIKHRAGVTEARKEAILRQLVENGLLDPAAATGIPGGVKAGVFPRVVSEGSGCPTNSQRFTSAPGSGNGGHHAYPGGLAVHTANNEASAMNLLESYSGSYGARNGAGMPVMNFGAGASARSILRISRDVLIAAPLWHDWAKILIFQWNADGTSFAELKFGGNGKTDKFGMPGTSVTAAHHILGIAETMARRLPADFVITQACAHAFPGLGNEFQVVNWLRAGAIIAQIDPVDGGYLIKDEKGALRLPSTAALRGSLRPEDRVSPVQDHLLVEYALHNLSDADFPFAITAMVQTDAILKSIARQFGYASADLKDYNVKFRNPVLANTTAERLEVIYENEGIAGVIAQVRKLKDQGII